MATATYGTLQEFKPAQETITAYLERLKAYFDANEVPSAKRVPVLLSIIGPSTYSILRSLMAPDTQQSKSLDALIKALKNHYDPKPIIIAERYHFHLRNQSSTETIADYIAELRRLATSCEFGSFLNEALRDRFVCGLRSESARWKLLTEAKLTLAKAVEFAQCMELAENNAKSFNGTEASVQKLSSTPRKGGGYTPRQHKPCHRCGRTNHEAATGRFSDATVTFVGKRDTLLQPAVRKRVVENPNNNAKYVSDATDEAEEEYFLHTVASQSSKPIFVDLQINDKTLQMELDTGAAFTIISERTRKTVFPELPLLKCPIRLKTYTDERIAVLGQLNVHVKYGDQRAPLVLLVVAGDGPTLLGRNWLRYIRLDWQRIHAVSKSDTATTLNNLLEKQSDLFKDELGKVSKIQATLHVRTKARPRFFKPRPVPFAIKPAIDRELDLLESSGVISKVTHSDWAAPIVPVPKSNGRFRICGDYKVTINQELEVDQYPLPKPEELFATLAGGRKFTKLDLSRAYQQLTLDEASKQYVTVNTHRGLYRYNRLPFGVASAPALFQKLMDSVLQGIPHVICYLDDILVTGTSDDEHLQNLETVLERLQQYGFRLKKEKCEFLKASVDYLGHKIDADGLHALPSKINAITSAPEPRDIQELRSFLGLLNYYGKFIPNLSTLVHPLNSLLQRSKQWEWTPECQQAFQQAKEALSSSQVLAHYDPSLPLHLAGDASAYGIGAVISHTLPDGSERPIAFASRSLSPSERNYAQLEKEALSLIFGVKKFHQYLYGRRFELITDHKPLTAILGPKKGIPSLAAARLQCWAVLLSAYQYNIRFKPTDQHANADGLSRLPLPSSPNVSTTASSIFNLSQIGALPITSVQVADATRKDSTLSKVLHFTKSGWQHVNEDVLKPYQQRSQEITVEGDCLLWGIRVILPSKLRDNILQELHRDHPGCSRMKSYARSYVWWPGMDKDIENVSKSCMSCQSHKNAPSPAPLHPWTWPTKPWKRIHIDFAGPFLGKSFLVVVDAHSKWPEVFEMSSTSAAKTIATLRSLFSSYGLPEQVVSDNGPQFVAEEFAAFLRENGVKHIRCTPYHPSSNGAVERFIQTFKQSMKASENDGRSLSHRLANFLLSYRSTPHSTTNRSPCSLFLNRPIRTRLSLVYPDTEQHVMNKQADQVSHHNQHAKARQFSTEQNVMVRNLRPGKKWVPGVIKKQLGPLTFLVEVENGILWKRHIDHLLDNATSRTVTSTSTPVDVDQECFTPSIPSDAPDDTLETATEHSTPRYPDRVRNPPDRFM